MTLVINNGQPDMTIWKCCAIALAVLWSSHATADGTQARCDIYPAGSDRLDVMLPCTFSQNQGFVSITRADGVVYEFAPDGDVPGNFRDQTGDRVYRQSGLGDQGVIFRLPQESVFVYWNPGLLEKPQAADNWTAPFTTDEYDATTRLNCRAAGDSEFGSCPAGILRMEDGQASIVVQDPRGEVFTINFMDGYVNATNREAETTFNGETWTVVIDGEDVYEVPRAAVEGG